MRHIVPGAIALLLTAMAIAQETRLLAKAEVEALASGKEWTQRLDDGGTVVWTLKGSGYVFTTHTGMARGTALDNRVKIERGNWLVKDDGQLCVTWPSGYPDQCVVVVREGEKLRVARPGADHKTFADLSVE